MDKFYKLRLICTAYLLATLLANASFCQVQTPHSITINSNCHGFYDYLPINYGTSGINYPLLIFIHGAGELGNGTTQLKDVLFNGPPRLINLGQWPTTFTTPQGKTYSMIVFTPQFVAWPTVADIEAVYQYAINHYRVNLNMVYVTGLSMGGGVTFDYVSASAANAAKIAAIVPICGTTLLSTPAADIVASNNVAAWVTHNKYDLDISDSISIKDVQRINSYKPPPKPLAKLTLFPDSGHNAWSRTYDPNWRDSGYNIYEWMLQYQRSFAVLPIKLKSFDAVPQADNSVKLDWSTDSGDNTGYFQVERSEDGINFNSIGKVTASGNTTGDNYDFVDKQTLTGVSYYRLAISDPNGETTYSEIRKVLIMANSKSGVTINPNPTYNDATLTINSQELGDFTATLFDMSGRQVQIYRFRKDQVYLTQNIPMYNVPRGDYVMVVRGKTLNESLRVTKQ
ncbi:MAG: hypothetical protein C5B52_18385 [Bacteroidetes bacterium]|nr:MAG: hypothetical protein C5B52_18385 [Bacteroidota bacterium]